MSEPNRQKITPIPWSIQARQSSCGGSCLTLSPFTGNLGRGLCRRFAPASCRLLGVFGYHDRNRLHSHKLAENCRSAGSRSVDVDASAPLDDFCSHDEYHAGACAGKQFGAFDVACAWHFSRRDQSSILGNLLSWHCHGAFGAGHLATPGKKHAPQRINLGLIPDLTSQSCLPTGALP